MSQRFMPHTINDTTSISNSIVQGRDKMQKMMEEMTRATVVDNKSYDLI